MQLTNLCYSLPKDVKLSHGFKQHLSLNFKSQKVILRKVSMSLYLFPTIKLIFFRSSSVCLTESESNCDSKTSGKSGT